MNKLLKLYVKLRYSEKGATAIEYALIVAAIAAIIVALVFGIGRQLVNGFQKVANALTGAGLSS